MVNFLVRLMGWNVFGNKVSENVTSADENALKDKRLSEPPRQIQDMEDLIDNQ